MTGRISHDPELWQERADHLRGLLRDLAQLRSNATHTHATEYLAASGTDKTREQAAKLAAGPDHLAAEEKAADVAAYQLMIEVWRADLAARPLGTILAGEQ